jgi:fumarate reductase subunit C
MPQLDFVTFHYILNSLTFTYLFVYVCISLFLLKPIFKEFYLFYSYPTVLFLDVLSLVILFSDKIIFTKLPRHVPIFSELKNKVRKRWDWYKYIPRMSDPYDEFEVCGMVFRDSIRTEQPES